MVLYLHWNLRAADVNVRDVGSLGAAPVQIQVINPKNLYPNKHVMFIF
jgi:hypothetical protein